MAELLGVGCALPEQIVTLAETQAHLASLLSDAAFRRFQAMAAHSRIARRHVVLPPADVIRLHSIEDRQREFIPRACELGESAARSAIACTGIDPASIELIISVSCTGYAMPSLDAHLGQRLEISPTARRIPITELGCSGGVAALGIAGELLRGRHDDSTALIVSTELCSLCMQQTNPQPSDILGWILFGDAAAAAVVRSGERAGLATIVGSRSVVWPESGRDLGMRLTTTGLRLELSARVPQLVRRHLRGTVDAFLREHGTCVSEVAFWALHPGGPRVLDAVGASLGLSDHALRPTCSIWEDCGNVSSATALLVLRRVLETRPHDGALGLVLALGPGMTCEMVLLRASGQAPVRDLRGSASQRHLADDQPAF
jgi:alkylresorcinol/alkylpyrone synthase